MVSHILQQLSSGAGAAPGGRKLDGEEKHLRAGRGPGTGSSSDWSRNPLVQVQVKVRYSTRTPGLGGGGGGGGVSRKPWNYRKSATPSRDV